ncbi:MAG: FKBP-type peptidyl-prolyl cis-trans isomerase [Arachnia sp.]
MRVTRQLLLPMAVGVALIGVTACGSDSTDPGDSASPALSEAVVSPSGSTSTGALPTAAIEASDNLDGITVAEGDDPEVSIPAPWAIDETRTKVLKPGEGQKLTDASIVTLNYKGINARTGEVFDSSYERGEPTTFGLQSVIVGFAKGLEGQDVGSRVLIAIPSQDGYAEGNEGAGIQVGDTIVFLVDIISANYDEATGEAVAPVEGLPTVTMTDEGPEIEIPDAAPPTELVVQPLIQGTGPEVTAASSVQVKYRTWVWDSGELVQDAWYPQQGLLSTLVKGWIQGLPGQNTGSRLLMIVPPELAYGNGNGDSPVEGRQTVVFVVDLLYAAEEG